MNVNTNYIQIGRMREGTGVWGTIYNDDGSQELREHRVSYLTRPQNEEHYGDKDVLHEQLTVREELDPATMPSDFRMVFDEVAVRRWNGSLGEFHWWSDGTFTVYAVNNMGQTPDGYGDVYPAGYARTVREAFRWYVEDNKLYFSELAASWSHDYEVPVRNRHGIIYYLTPWSTVFNKDWYTEAWRTWVYNQETGEWNTSWLGENNPIRGQIRIPIIPWNWRTWMWSMHPPIPVTDHEAYSECYRNAVSNITWSGMNNIANVLEVGQTLIDLKRGNITSLFESLKDLIDDPKSWNRAVKFSQDAWLKYRYVYGTTKADADAAVDYFLDEKWKSLTDRQVVRGQIELSDGTMRLKMRLRESADLSLNIWNDFKSVGMFPDLYTIWDLVPYSFVVDWFVPSFSNELEDLSQRYLGAAYDVLELEVTRKREWDIRFAGFTYHAKSYSRLFDSEPPQFEFYEESTHASKKTVIKRVIDGFSLFINF
jgi:hypothetical protein